MAVYTHALPSGGQVTTCESWGEFLDHVSSDAPHTMYQSHATGRDDWAGTKDFDSAMSLARDGWLKGAERIRNMSQRLEAKLIHKIVREDWNYDVEGHAFDIARYLSNEPEHWHTVEESDIAENAHRHVRINYNITASCGVGTDVIEARGAACAALIELLEYAGHRVELWVSMSCSANHSEKQADAWAVVMCKVKSYDQHMTPDRIAFAVAHPSMLRRLMFAGFEHLSLPVQKKISWGYGLPCEYKADDTAIYLGHAMWGNSQWLTPSGAEAWILGELAKQGVVIRED